MKTTMTHKDIPMNHRPYAAPDAPVISPAELSQLLGQQYAPTEQQAAVISAPANGAFLVVAGAGAGKTETMAARVVWLVANGFVLPEQVLGLTFTRKAAAELRERVRGRLETLAQSAFMDTLSASDPRRAALATIAPTVSTYDSYAGDIVREYGLLIPIEPTGRLISDAEQWMLARDVVRNYTGEMSLGISQATLIERLRKLASEMDNHLASPEEVVAASLAAKDNLENLPRSSRARTEFTNDHVKFMDVQQARVQLVGLVEAYRKALEDRNLMTFGQQMSLAADVVTRQPMVGEQQRRRFRVVLLDEYQDTGHAQRILLRGLFGDGQDDALSVTAVGDPMQSIYQFRGATASNLEKFRQDFRSSTGCEADKLQLTTSWRNPAGVLDLANEVSGWSMEGRRMVQPLEPRPGAGDGEVSLAFFDEEDDELTWLADNLQQLWQDYDSHRKAAADPSTIKPFSAAVLIRKNKQAVPIFEKLRERGVPAEMTAGPGLLDLPEVADVYAALRVLVDPSDDVALLRLLTGPRWNIGAADLMILAKRAEQVAARGAHGQAEDSAGSADSAADSAIDNERREEKIQEYGLEGYPDHLVDQVLKLIPDDSEIGVGLADALADVSDAREMGMSENGAERISQLSAELGHLRRNSLSKPLPDLISDIERMMGVRTEVLTRWYRDPSAGLGTSHLDKFATIVREFSEISSASPTALVEYLRAAHDQESGLEPGEVVAKTNTVQILTVHKAKGLEWDIVAVPHANRNQYEDAMQVNARDSTWVSAADQLPTELRGDAEPDEHSAPMPVLDTSGVEDRSKHTTAVKEFVHELKQFRAKESDRVFYVAITRTERVLLVSGSAFSTGKKGVDPAVCFVLMRNYLEQHRDGQGIAHWSELGATYAKLDKEWEKDPLPREHSLMLPTPEVNGRRLDYQEDREAREIEEAFAGEAFWPRGHALERLPGADEARDIVKRLIPGASEDKPLGDGGVAAPDNSDNSGNRATPTQAQAWDEETELLLRELDQGTRTIVDVNLDVRLTATEMVALRANEQEFAKRKRRPVPLEPKPFAKRGTAFHNWVEQRYDHVSLLDDEQLPGAADATYQDPQLQRLKDAFLQSEWADRQPDKVEGAYSVTLGGRVFEGRIDAVFYFSDDPSDGWMIVDWKTGRKPVGKELEAATMQLAVYRLAWAKVLSHRLGVEVPVDNVRAAFHYVAFNETFEPRTLPTAEELEEILGERESK